MVCFEFLVPMVVMPLYDPFGWWDIIRECRREFPKFVLNGHRLV